MKKIIVLLMGLTLGANMYSANKLSAFEVVSGTIAKYCLYLSALGCGLSSLESIGKAFSIADQANRMNFDFFGVKGYLYDKANSHLLSAGICALIGYGTYKTARVINYGLDKNSEIRPQENERA